MLTVFFLLQLIWNLDTVRALAKHNNSREANTQAILTNDNIQTLYTVSTLSMESVTLDIRVRVV